MPPIYLSWQTPGEPHFHISSKDVSSLVADGETQDKEGLSFCAVPKCEKRLMELRVLCESTLRDLTIAGG